MPAAILQRSHVRKGILTLGLLSLFSALFVSPALAADRTLASYGALCNGSADDTAELRAAFADAGTKWTNLVFPANGTCRITGKINVENKSGFRVTGQNATIKAANGMKVDTGWYLLSFIGSSSFQVYDLTVDGNRANRAARVAAAHNIVLADTHDFLLQNVHANNSVTDGFEIRGRSQAETSTAHYSTDGDLINCGASNNYRVGMHIQNAARVNINGGSFSNSNGHWPQAGIDVEPNPGSASPAIYDIVITGAQFTGNNGYGLQLSSKYATQRITVEKSYFSDNARGGVKVGSRYATVRNNLFELFIRNTGISCPDTYCFRSVIELPSGALGNSMIEANSLIDARPYSSGIFVHKAGASGTTIRNNCLENVLPLAIVNGGNKASLSGNQVNPSGGCPLPSEVPLP